MEHEWAEGAVRFGVAINFGQLMATFTVNNCYNNLDNPNC
jgi:hypothetical protein